MADYNYILNLFSLLLIIAILFIIVYGCQYQKHRNYRVEKFTDIEEYDNSLEKVMNDEKEKEKIAEFTKKLTTDEISVEQFTNLMNHSQVQR